MREEQCSSDIGPSRVRALQCDSTPVSLPLLLAQGLSLGRYQWGGAAGSEARGGEGRLGEVTIACFMGCAARGLLGTKLHCSEVLT